MLSSYLVPRPAVGAFGLGLVLLACSAAPSAPAIEPEAAPAAAPRPSASSEDAAPAKEAPPPTTPAQATTGGEPASEEPSACPANMVLVEGDYCTEVEHKCVEHWYSEANKKKVCEEFEPWSKCVGERVKKRYCIDKFSWPNIEGERPEVMNNFYQAQVKCAAVGKRMCTESEWTLACEGPEMKPFPYGYVRDSNKCNGDNEWDHPDMNKVARRDPTELARLWQGVPSGSQPYCISDYGVHDLPANNDEVVASENFSSTWRGKYDSVHTGGPWYTGVRNQCRPKIYTHEEGFYYYFLGFRCCAEPDGVATDPRTPKQRKKDREFSYVERLARFSVEQMKQKLELKKQGKCDCDDVKGKHERILCKTMCGTLLGPDAKDAVKGPVNPEPSHGASKPGPTPATKPKK